MGNGRGRPTPYISKLREGGLLAGRLHRLDRNDPLMLSLLIVLAGQREHPAGPRHRELPHPVVFDHFGGANAALGTQQPGFETLLGLLRSGKIYVKISAAYRASKEAPDYPDVTPLAKALIAANPERILWGSDWPHPATPVDGRPISVISPLTQVDDGRILNLLPVWAPQAALRKTILVENPARLFGF